MLIRIGTNSFHISIGLFYYYEMARQLNFLEIVVVPGFAFTITSKRPFIYFMWGRRIKWPV